MGLILHYTTINRSSLEQVQKQQLTISPFVLGPEAASQLKDAAVGWNEIASTQLVLDPPHRPTTIALFDFGVLVLPVFEA
eukprot:scaffold25547_cov113-Cylindrotheca_fusiformis.AAC.1